MSIDLERGLIILIVGVLIVFLGLVLLYLVFQYVVPSILSIRTTKKPVVVAVAIMPEHKKEKYRTGEEIAAIAAAIHLFMEEAHDEENAILTIGMSSKNYSPWSSKIYGTQNMLRK